LEADQSFRTFVRLCRTQVDDHRGAFTWNTLWIRVLLREWLGCDGTFWRYVRLSLSNMRVTTCVYYVPPFSTLLMHLLRIPFTVYSKQLNPRQEHPVLMTEAPLNLARIGIILPRFNASLILILYAPPPLVCTLPGRTTGVVLDGEGVTHAVPVRGGFALQHFGDAQIGWVEMSRVNSSCSSDAEVFPLQRRRKRTCPSRRKFVT
jgi:hypothetical protein